MFDFSWPYAFILLPLPFLYWWLLPAGKMKQQTAIRVPFFQRIQHLQQFSSQTFLLNSALSRKIMMILCWILIIIALSGPQWIGSPQAIKRSGRDIMLAIDLSGSMSTPDMRLNNHPARRLDVVKAVAGKFISAREGDRLGLVLFGTRAYLQTPLTYDRKTVQQMLNDATIGLAGPQTAIGDAIGLATKRLMHYPEKSRALILLTDGGNNAGVVSPLAAAKLAAREHIKIYTIGIGTDQMLVPGLFGPQLIHTQSDVDVKTLTTIANITGGKFFRARDTATLQQIYNDINQLEPIQAGQQIFRPTISLYEWPLALALLLILVLLLPTFIPRKVSC